MSYWEHLSIAKLGRVVTGKTPPTEELVYWNGSELFVSPKDMEFDSLYIRKTQSLITNQALEKFKNQVLPPNAIMYTALSFGFGKIGLSDRRVLTNQQINSVVVNKDNDFRFVYYLLRASTPYIFSFNSGIDTPIVPKSVFEKIKLKVPPLPIQRKIAAVLSAYDDLIENNTRRIAILEKMAEELYREWFVRLRFPGHEKTKIVKGVPEGWEVKRLADIANLRMGQSPSSEFFNDKGIGLPFHQGVGTYGLRFPQTDTWCSVDGKTANQGDILFSVRAPVGRLNIANCKMTIGRGLSAISHKYQLNSYLFYLLKTCFADEDIIGNGAIFNAVGRGELENFKIVSPSDNLVRQFEKIANPIDAHVTALLGKQRILISSRDRLLSRLMSGKIDLEHLDIHFPPSMCEEEPVHA